MGAIQYCPLDRTKNEIRLVKLYQRAPNSADKDESQPHCDLIHTSLDENPKYVALSYTWGDTWDNQDIIIGNITVPVTRNLHSAMLHLRATTTTKTFWIDALCINQADDREKSWQVQLMRDIFARADHVTIWLGPADATSDTVMEFLRSFGTKAIECGIDSHLEEVRAHWRKLASHPSSIRDQSKSRVVLQSPEGEKTGVFELGDLSKIYYSISGFHEQSNLFPIEGMENLFTRPFWSRTWVLQEITVCQKAGFVCGTKLLSRRKCRAAINAFCALRSVLSERSILQGENSTAYQRKVCMANFDPQPVVMLFTRDAWRHRTFPLLALLRATCIGELKSSTRYDVYQFAATDPRDKIYGILGLAADRDELWSLGIEPDYAKSCTELYTCVASAILSQGHMNLLSLCQLPKHQAGLPSWVPDWSKPLILPIQRTEKDHMTTIPKYRASGPLNQRAWIRNTPENKPVLCTSAFVCDEIHEVGISWTQANTTPSELFISARKYLEEFIRLGKLRGDPHRDVRDRLRAAARTATAEIGINDNGSWERFGDCHRDHATLALMNMILPGHIADERVLPELQLLQQVAFEQLQSSTDRRSSVITKVAKFMGELDAKASRRVPFVTRNGHLGLGPIGLKPGDSITLIGGADMPFVLRQDLGGMFQLIGESYVDAIMDGEMITGEIGDMIDLY